MNSLFLMGKRIFLSGIFGSVLLFTRNDEWAKMGDVPQKRSRGYRQEEEEIVKREWEMERKRERGRLVCDGQYWGWSRVRIE